jgi:hypothetical protein
MPRQVYLFLLVISVILYSCGGHDSNQTSNNVRKDSGNVSEDTSSSVSGEDAGNSANAIEKIVQTYNYNTAKCDWIKLDTFFPVFQFGPDTVGITFEIHSDQGFTCIDSLFYFATSKTEGPTYGDIEHVDHKFKHNDALQKKIRLAYHSKLYLYGTKGIDTVYYKDVVYELDECGSSVIVLKIPGINKNKVGHPLFCSRSLFQLQYGRFPDIEEPLDREREKDSSDWQNKTPVKIYARCDSLYFGYDDDFKWTLTNNDSLCVLPSRFVVVKPEEKGKKAIYKWHFGLDLFGIPCD